MGFKDLLSKEHVADGVKKLKKLQPKVQFPVNGFSSVAHTLYGFCNTIISDTLGNTNRFTASFRVRSIFPVQVH